MKRTLFAVLIAGCGPGGATADDAGPTSDGDAAAGSGVRWRLETRPATSLAVLGDTAINAGRPARVKVGVDLGPCDEIAMPRIDIVAGQITIGLAAWVPVGEPCTSTARSIVRPVILSWGPFATGDWVISATGTPDTVTISIAAEPADCDPARSPCTADCDCPTGERCLSNDAASGPSRVCATPCEVDRDCQGGTCVAAGANAPWSCVPTPPECGLGDPCPTGWSCTAGVCLPDFVLKTTTRNLCASDTDCVPGLRCVEAADPATSPRCQAVCETVGPWCSTLHQCFTREQDVSNLAGTDAVCGWIGE